MLASDAFFPFADGPQVALDAGIAAVVQPGGSKRDDEVVAACRQIAELIGPLDPLIVGRAQVVFERGEHVITAPGS